MPSSQPHTDIDTQSGVIARLPGFARPYGVLLRLDRPIGWWLLLLPGWWAIPLSAGGVAAMTGRDWALMALFWIGAVIMRGAGCIVNDLWDRDLDRKVGRTAGRPLAGGQLGVKQAAGLLLLCLGLGFLILLQTSPLCIGIGVFSLLMIAAYPYMKRITWWPQVFLGLTFNLSALMGWAAVTGRLDAAPVLLYLAGIAWTIGYDTIYAAQDREDDALAGIKSTARLFGRHIRRNVGIAFAAAFLLLQAAALAAEAGLLTHLLLCLPGLHFAAQLTVWHPDDPASSLRLFKANRDAGLLAALAFMLSGF